MKRDVDSRLSGFLDSKLDEARTYGKDVETMVASVRDLCMRGGKRMRPALVVVGVRAVSATMDLEPALDAGAALELLQAYFLVHDDWMDGDDTRRGGPSVHAFLTRQFRSSALGERSAILGGDYLAALATEALARVEMRPARMPAVFTCFAQMQTDAVLGQQLDVLAREGDVETTYRLKTGSYSVRGPLRLGALLAGATPRQLLALDRYALPIGVAFQLRDDLLNAFGDPALTGKPQGSDLTSGKRTALSTLAFQRAEGRDLRQLKRVFGKPESTPADVQKALAVIAALGVKNDVEQRIAELIHTAGLGLRRGGLTPAGLLLLQGAARALTERGS